MRITRTLEQVYQTVEKVQSDFFLPRKIKAQRAAMTSFLFFLLLTVAVGVAVQSARRMAILPESKPGRVVAAPDGERMNVGALICTCGDWQHRRARFAEGTPMRLCCHLTIYFSRHLDLLPKSMLSMTAMTALMGMEKQGMPCGPGTEYGHLDGQAYVLYIVSSQKSLARLILGGRRHELRLAEGNWHPGPPEQASYFSLRARQLASLVLSK